MWTVLNFGDMFLAGVFPLPGESVDVCPLESWQNVGAKVKILFVA